MNNPPDHNAPGDGPAACDRGPECRWHPWPAALDLLAANALAVFVPFAMFRYVMLKAFQTFNLGVSADEVWLNLPALVWRDVALALGIAVILTGIELAARRGGRRVGALLKIACWLALPLVALLSAALFAVYLDMGFFPSIATIRTYLSPGSPLLETAGTYGNTRNAGVLAVVVLFPPVVKGLCLRYRRVARGLGLMLAVLLPAGLVWPTDQTLARAGVHPFGQIYDGLVRTTPDWDLERWRRRPVSYDSISGTYSAESFAELSGAFADYNVVLVLLESTARCCLCDERGRWVYPNLARLAGAGMDFTRYYTGGDASLSSLFSLFAARGPVPLRASRWDYPSDGRMLWPMELKRRGCRTAFFHANAFGAWFDRRLFESMQWDALEDAGAIAYHYGVDPESSSRLREVVDERLVARRLMDWMAETRRLGQRFLACYFSGIPHLPYDFRDRTEYVVHRGETLTRRQSYENQLAYVDVVLGELYDHLLTEGFFDNGLLLVTADHGEAFGQHPGVVVHSTHVYEENVHVPLLVVNPGRLNGLVNPNPGSHVDFWPTLADLLGIELPAGAQGRSLLQPSDRPMVFIASVEDDVKVGVVDGRYMYIYNRRVGSSELFDLLRDPGEKCDLSTQQPDLVEAYRDWVHSYVARELGARRDDRTLTLETHVSLGYERLGFGRLTEARSHFAEALEIDPRSVEALLGLGTVLTRQGQAEEAVAVLQRAVEVAPDDPRVATALGLACLEAGRVDDALRHCTRALELAPAHPGARTTLARALVAAGRTDEALAEFERALRDDPADADAHEALGRVLLSEGDRAAGLEHLRACLRIAPTRESVRAILEGD